MYVYANERIEFYYDNRHMNIHFSYCLKDPVSDELFVQSKEIGINEDTVQAYLPGIGYDTEVMKEYAQLMQLNDLARSYGNCTNLFSEEYLVSIKNRYAQVRTNVVLSPGLIQKSTLDSYRSEYTYRTIQEIREMGIQWLRYNERRRNEDIIKDINTDWVLKEIYRIGLKQGREISEISESIYKNLTNRVGA